ncbi:hypothetical protein DH2020_018622 [Rehmannia glutinosa]|uniref:Tf2-1-like SH3-like domain-containing protein n=1 Tax=Rehmannia glutinosa TaxID=99300 RepID=A0ABR0WKM4_REHGL
MLRACTLDFQENWDSHLPWAEFAYNNSYQATIGVAPNEALHRRKSSSPLHREISRQKNYADKRRKDLQFKEGDEVFLRLSPRKRLIHPKKGGKLSPRFIGPYKILKRVGKLAYQLELPPHIVGMHDVFHVSRLRKYQPDPHHIITEEIPPIIENLSYTEKPIRIIDRQVRQLIRREILIVKKVWQAHDRDEDATWEIEDEMRRQYPKLF